MDIANLSLQSLILEVRYPPAFRLLEVAGGIWTEALEHWPDMHVVEAASNQTRVRLRNRFELAVQLERAFVAAAGLKLTLEEFLPFCSFLCERALILMRVDALRRVGFKITFLKQYTELRTAVDDFYSTGLVKRIDGKIFGIDGEPKAPNLSVQFEDEYRGCIASFLVRERHFALETQLIGEEIEADRHYLELVLEFDYFTKAPMNINQLRINRWLEEAMHVVRRDSAQILRP